jgi:hypothetical protein
LNTTILFRRIKKLIEIDAVLTVYGDHFIACPSVYDDWRLSLALAESTGVSRTQLLAVLRNHSDQWVKTRRTSSIRRAFRACQSLRSRESVDAMWTTIQQTIGA